MFAGYSLTQPVLAWTSGKQTTARHIVEYNGRFVCGLCQKSYRSRLGCYAHYEVHLGNTTCEFCNKVLADKSALSKHRTQHLGRIRCELCNRTFATNYDLKKHLKLAKCGGQNS